MIENGLALNDFFVAENSDVLIRLILIAAALIRYA